MRSIRVQRLIDDVPLPSREGLTKLRDDVPYGHTKNAIWRGVRGENASKSLPMLDLHKDGLGRFRDDDGIWATERA